jgi:hypothetical protein
MSRRIVIFVALSLLALESAGTRAPALTVSADGPPMTGAPAVSQRLLAALRSKIPIEPVASAGDPYLVLHADPPLATAGTLCGVRFEPDQVHYRLSTFASPEAARAAGFAATHVGACGTCSTLQDLAVYLEKPDLTAPVRHCGISWDASGSLKCLEGLGFSDACAHTWLYNLENTRRQCFSVCILSWIRGESATQSDGRLNACLQCDEDRSGPIFKATAGRTRRNSGIRSSIPRPSEEIAPIVHDYVPDLAPR